MDIGVPGSTDIQNKLIEQLDPENNKIDRLKKREIELMQDILTLLNRSMADLLGLAL